jgi:hypothetical protein
MDSSCAERRFFPRHRVRVVVLWCNRENEIMVGEICDVSATGVFLVSRTALPDTVGIGDRTRITVRTEYGEADLVGTVRWRGFHPTYEAIGCGIRLDQASETVISRLFPELATEQIQRG